MNIPSSRSVGTAVILMTALSLSKVAGEVPAPKVVKTRRRRSRSFFPWQPAPRLFRARREKYPGQSIRYLVGAHTEMSVADLHAFNAEVDRRREVLREERRRAEAEAALERAHRNFQQALVRWPKAVAS